MKYTLRSYLELILLKFKYIHKRRNNRTCVLRNSRDILGGESLHEDGNKGVEERRGSEQAN